MLRTVPRNKKAAVPGEISYSRMGEFYTYFRTTTPEFVSFPANSSLLPSCCSFSVGVVYNYSNCCTAIRYPICETYTSSIPLVYTT